MKMPLLATLFVNTDSSASGDAPGLRDLILGLHSGSISAAVVLDRLDPGFADEIRAFVVHRGLTAENFIANALLAFALDVADQSWRQGLKSRQPHSDDPEADMVADLLREIMRQRRDREIHLASPAAGRESHVTLGRRRN
ncbi:MAG TPA: hypothetical protein VGB93_04080 [Methylovirgula sp.]